MGRWLRLLCSHVLNIKDFRFNGMYMLYAIDDYFADELNSSIILLLLRRVDASPGRRACVG